MQGCAAEPLGSMRYVPLASPALLARHAAGDVVDLGAMPMMRYNAKDDLQRLALSGAGLDVAPPTHLAPSFDGFHRSVRAGLGWGMLVPVGWSACPGSTTSSCPSTGRRPHCP